MDAGYKVRWFRSLRGMTQAELSRASSVNQSTICRIERGDLDIGDRRDAIGAALGAPSLDFTASLRKSSVLCLPDPLKIAMEKKRWNIEETLDVFRVGEQLPFMSRMSSEDWIALHLAIIPFVIIGG